MSQYNNMPPPGAYVPPHQNQSTPPPQGYGAQFQQPGYQQSQAVATHQSPTQGYGQPSQSYKGSSGAFGQMMNQAVTTSKPMLNKLSKTISSKLGNKPSTTGTPQHLQSYQNYHQHYGQQPQTHLQPQSQVFNPHTQQTPQLQAPSAYAPQQPAFGQGQGNYHAQQTPQTPQTPYSQPTPPPHKPHQTNYNGAPFNPGVHSPEEQLPQSQQGQYHQGGVGQVPGQVQTPGQHEQQPLQAQYTGQQTGVVGSSPHFQLSNPQSPHIATASPHSPAPQQTQWQTSHPGSEPSVVSAHQQQPPAAPAHTQSFFSNTNSHMQSNTSQQWGQLSPTGSDGRQSQTAQASVSPPPLPNQSKPPGMPSTSPLQSPSSTSAPQSGATYPGSPTEFIAELPADLGSMSIAETKPVITSPAPPALGQTSPYQAYQAPTTQESSSPGFTIARRAVSISSAPFADPWRFADPLTELPTREFYVMADLLFDALDRKFEPQNTGMLEASKILRSWVDLTEDATQLFSHNTYSAFGKLWSLQGIPHMLVPCQPSLIPIWNFSQHSHAHELKLSSPTTVGETYIPALNRAGWYKFFFLEMMHGPDNINKLISILCPDTYKPGVLHHPDLNKRDRAEAPALQTRATEIQTIAVNQVCNEVKAAMLVQSHV